MKKYLLVSGILIFGWLPLVVFWGMMFSLEEMPSWSLGLPSFSTVVFLVLMWYLKEIPKGKS